MNRTVPLYGNSDNGYYMSSSSSNDTTSSNSYPFYVELDSDDDLMLGQHVYLEKDEGQLENREGLWLTSYYIVQEDGQDPYVWTAGKHDKIEKRKVTLGEYDEKLDQYQITDGLTEDDYIAYPEDSIVEGEKVTRNIQDLYGNDSDVENPTSGSDTEFMNGSDGEILDDDGDGEGLSDEGSDNEGYVGAGDAQDEEAGLAGLDEEDDSSFDMPQEELETGDAPSGAE